MHKSTFFYLFLLLQAVFYGSYAQTGVIRGKVSDATSNEPLPFVSVGILSLGVGAVSNEEGNYEITGLAPGVYNLSAGYVGYKNKTIFEVEVSNARVTIVNISLEEDGRALEEVVVRASEDFYKPEESPLSLRTIGQNEIKRFPGGNRDISRVVGAFPGVAAGVAFRNDLVIRGGGPNENRFYLDGIEVPNINHFATQGASGGPVGLINVDLISEVEFYSGAFPANRGNALSSVLEFKQKEGRTDKAALNFIVSATDIGLTLDTPISEESSLILSVRRSYLQFLFKALGLPFLPTYNDYQFKYTYNFGKKSRLSIISLGALDDFGLNLDANETDEQRFLLNNLPVFEQWNYAIGAKYEYFRKDGFYTIVLSRNMLNNVNYKYPNNDESQPRILDYRSQEIENKLRIEDYRYTASRFKINYGINYEYARYFNRTQNTLIVPDGQIQNNFLSEFDMHKWGLFGQVSKSLLNERLSLSLGIRADANNFAPSMERLWEQFSPRLSASYSFNEYWSWNFNVGRFFQLPPYTVLGYRNPQGAFVNRDNAIRYIQSDHLVSGFEYRLPKLNSRITLEGFWKQYSQYPFLVGNQVSLANLGSDFGVIGNEEATSTSEGRSYGLELLYQQKLRAGFYGILAYTLVRSEFKDGQGQFRPSAWDNIHIVSLTGGRRWGKNWELGGRFLFSGGAPFTPFNITQTVTRQNWDINGRGIPDFSRLNEGRGQNFHQLDLRVDKRWFFPKWSLNLFLDVRNVYGFTVRQPDNIDVLRDANGQPLVNPDNPDLYQFRFLANEAGTTLPSIGIIVEL